MHLFSRAVQFVGPMPEVMAYATDIRQYVSDKAGQDIGLWQVGFGAPLGSMVFTARVNGVAGAMELSSTFADDAEYHAKLAKGAQFRGGPTMDSLGEPIHGDMDGDPPPVGSIASVTSAQIATGKYADAFGWGVEVAQHIEKVSGVPMAFLQSVFGQFGAVTWIAVYPDAAAADAANAAVNGDEGYMKMIGDIGGMFVEGSGSQSMVVRVA
jgi:hypothetical protein